MSGGRISPQGTSDAVGRGVLTAPSDGIGDFVGGLRTARPTRGVPWQALILVKSEPRHLGCYGVLPSPLEI